jgi:Fe-S cluster assembly protein SufD
LAGGAHLNYYRIQNEGLSAYHIGHTRVWQKRNSTFESFVFSLGSKLGRHNLWIELDGEGSLANMNGLYLSHEGQHQDSFSVVDHKSAQAQSHQYYKGIISEKSRAVFNGKILIRKDSQKTDSSQLNRNLLLGKNAEIDTRPQLEIYADDVKAAHGASIGRLNRDQIFYLESRGISRTQALDLLCRGFAEDVVFRIPNEDIRSLIDPMLAEAFTKMKLEPS